MQSTLRSIFSNLKPKDKLDTLVVVFIAETNISIVSYMANVIKSEFAQQLESGILDLISPPKEYYPDWSRLKLTLGMTSMSFWL